MGYEANMMVRPDFARLEAEASALHDMPAPTRELQDGGDPGVSFAGALRDAIQSVNAKDQAAAEKVAAVESGRSDDLVGAMLSSQEASLSFSMLMQVRNKVVGAVDELIKLQI